MSHHPDGETWDAFDEAIANAVGADATRASPLPSDDALDEVWARMRARLDAERLKIGESSSRSAPALDEWDLGLFVLLVSREEVARGRQETRNVWRAQLADETVIEMSDDGLGWTAYLRPQPEPRELAIRWSSGTVSTTSVSANEGEVDVSSPTSGDAPTSVALRST